MMPPRLAELKDLVDAARARGLEPDGRHRAVPRRRLLRPRRPRGAEAAAGPVPRSRHQALRAAFRRHPARDGRGGRADVRQLRRGAVSPRQRGAGACANPASADAHVLFCPTEYCAAFAGHDVPDSAYLNTLGSELAPRDRRFSGPGRTSSRRRSPQRACAR